MWTKENGIVYTEDSRKSKSGMIYCKKVRKGEKMSYNGLSDTKRLEMMLDMKETAEEMIPVLIKQKEELEEDLSNVKTKTAKYFLEKAIENKTKSIKEWIKEASKYTEKVAQLQNK